MNKCRRTPVAAKVCGPEKPPVARFAPRLCKQMQTTSKVVFSLYNEYAIFRFFSGFIATNGPQLSCGVPFKR